MTTIQRYRHIPVLPPVVGAGIHKNRTIDRAALVKKAITMVYGEELAGHDPAFAAAILMADVWAFTQHCALDAEYQRRRAQSIRSDHDFLGRQEQATLDAQGGE